MEPDDFLVANTLDYISQYVRETDRPGEAEGFFGRALEVRDAIREPDDLSISCTLNALGWRRQQADQPGEVATFSNRELEIRDAPINPKNCLLPTRCALLGAAF